MPPLAEREAQVVDVINDQSGLLLSADHGSAIPIATRAFSVAQGSKGAIKKRNIGSILVLNDGRCLEVVNIIFLRLYGENFLRRVISLFTSAYKIRVVFKPAELNFGDVRAAVIASLLKESMGGDGYFSQSSNLENVLPALERSTTIAELFRVLELDEEDQLDVMC